MRDLSTIVEFWTGGPKLTPEGFRQIAARSILAAKVAMRENFPAGLVHDPAVEIMMSVFLAGADGGSMALDDACAATGAAPAVAKRWIAALKQHGLIETRTGADGASIALTAEGLACTTRAIDAMVEQQTRILG